MPFERSKNLINVTEVRFGAEIEESVLSVLRSGNIAQGPKVAEFENLFREIAGTKHAVAVNNGTTSLIAALSILDLGPGDEVITSPFTFIATLNAILATGATAVMAEISENDFNITAESVSALITPRTKAIVPVHLYGQMANMIEIEKIANVNGLDIVEDSAQSHGASILGRPAGSFGQGSFSFYATKNLTTGEGGIITTNDDSQAEKLRILRNQGMRNKYEYVMPGNNFRMTDLQAAVVIPQINTYDSVIDIRKKNAARLTQLLTGKHETLLPQELEGRKHVWHQYTIALPDAIDREKFVVEMSNSGVNVGVYYPKLVSDYEIYQAHSQVRAESVSIARNIASRVVSLPVHQYLTDENLQTIAHATETAIESSVK